MSGFFFNDYPYTDFHELNLSWLIRKIIELNETVKNFVNLETIKYADPIQWNIASQYEKNTVVIDPQTGTAYLSVAPVPSGVALSNPDYWTVIFDLNIAQANNNITLRDDGNNVLSTFTSDVGDWLLWNGTLYRVTQAIGLSQAYVIGYNIERYTVELFVKDYITALETVIGDLDDLTTTDKTNIVNAINELVTIIGDLNDLNTTDKSSVVNAINEVYDDTINNFVYNTIEDCGIVNDDTTDNATAFGTLTDNVGLKSGGYKISTSCTINAQLVFTEGAYLDIDSGVTVTINGQIVAGRYEIFKGTGNVSINRALQPFGYPEWFGAVVNDSGHDNASAINKCITQFNETVLSDGVYYVANTVTINRSNASLIGSGQSWGSGGTMIKASTVSLSPVVLLGYDTAPGSINAFCNNNKIEHLTISGYGSDFINGSIALQMSYALRSYLHDVQCRDAGVCCLNKCTVAVKIFKCDFFSTLLSDGDTTRTCDLLRIYNSSDELNVGASASLQIINCHFSIGGIAYAQSYGIRAFGARFSDLMITGCEINSVYYGITLVGNNSRTGTLDILISNNVIDSVVVPVNMSTMAFGMVDFINNYMAGTSATTVLMTISACVNCNISHNQFIGYSSNNCSGIVTSNSVGLQLIDNLFYEVSICVNAGGALTDSKISGLATNGLNTANALINAVSLSRCKINMSCSSNFTNGIVSVATSKCSIDFSGVMATNPLIINSTPITPTNGYSSATTNYFYGVMA